jgi:hypothetical protein
MQNLILTELIELGNGGLHAWVDEEELTLVVEYGHSEVIRLGQITIRYG